MMRALREFVYAQQRRRAGDRFTVVPKQHVAALQAAKLAEVETPATEATPPTDEVRPLATMTQQLESADVKLEKRGRGRPKGSPNKNRYRHRALVAE